MPVTYSPDKAKPLIGKASTSDSAWALLREASPWGAAQLLPWWVQAAGPRNCHSFYPQAAATSTAPAEPLAHLMLSDPTKPVFIVVLLTLIYLRDDNPPA